MKRKRFLILMVLIVIVPVGFYTKFYTGPASNWVGNSMGGFFYEVFWCLVVAFILPRCHPLKIALWVFGATCLLEFMQLWHPPLLEQLRSGFIGRTVLGNSFNGLDFPYYAAGCLAGFYVLRIIGEISGINRHTSGQPGQ